jgi:hypothetical protein
MTARVLCIVLVAGLVAVSPAVAADRQVPRGWLGVTADGPMTARDGWEWDRMALTGVETVRTAFFWAELQPHAPGATVPHGRGTDFRLAGGVPTDFSSTDALVVAAARRGLALLPVVQWPPNWSASQPDLFGSPPRSPDDVQRLFTALVERYGPAGSFWAEHPRLRRLPIRSWQVFNEPNVTYFWSMQPFADSYVGVLRAAAAGIRAADPRAKVVLAGLTGESWTALESIYAAGGRGSFDVVALHPYSPTTTEAIRFLRSARRVMRAHGDRRLPLWITEIGWPASEGRYPDAPDWGTTNAGQAERFDQTMRRLVALRRRLRIDRVIWYTWLSAERDDYWPNYTGLRRQRGDARIDTPVLAAFRTWASALEGCSRRKPDARRCPKRPR